MDVATHAFSYQKQAPRPTPWRRWFKRPGTSGKMWDMCSVKICPLLSSSGQNIRRQVLNICLIIYSSEKNWARAVCGAGWLNSTWTRGSLENLFGRWDVGIVLQQEGSPLMTPVWYIWSITLMMDFRGRIHTTAEKAIRSLLTPVSHEVPTGDSSARLSWKLYSQIRLVLVDDYYRPCAPKGNTMIPSAQPGQW